MNSEQRQHRSGDGLGYVIAFDEADRAIWPVEEMRRVFRMQLGARLHLELERTGVHGRDMVLELAEQASPPIRSIADLLHHRCPPGELLWAVKEFAKNRREEPGSDVSPEIALAIYYAAIASALVRRGERITTLSDDEMRMGLNWVVKQNWLDERTRRLIASAMHHLRAGRHLWRRS